MKIIRKTGQFVSLFILSVMCVMLLSDHSVRAAEYSCDVSIPVTVNVSGSDITTGVKYEVNLEAVTESAPMPETTTLTTTDAGTVEFGTMTYTTPGDYVYTITQTKGSQDRCTYDTTVYTVTVRVINSEEGGLVPEIWAVKNGGTEKTSSIVFTNTYSAIPVEEEEPEEDPVEPEETPADPDTTTSAQTGDTANITLYVVVMAAAAAVIIFLVLYSKRKKAE